VNEDTLEDVLLFVGILSGRGYRHRRLAVREAWANQCQKPGVSVCRFMLSEDEVTPQASFRPLTCTLQSQRAQFERIIHAILPHPCSTPEERSPVSLRTRNLQHPYDLIVVPAGYLQISDSQNHAGVEQGGGECGYCAGAGN
jgi:hypothetical protein